jgi:hypothetical protein
MANVRDGYQKYVLSGNVEAYVLIEMMTLALVFYLLILFQIEKLKLLFGSIFIDMKPIHFPTLPAIGMFFLSWIALVQSLRNRLKELFKGLGRTIGIQLFFFK